MLAPHVAEDVDILQRHISQHKTSEGEDPQSYQTLSHDTRNPIVYLSVPRYRTGLRPEIGPGKEQLEIIEQVIGPFKDEVIDLYFQRLHPHFPILDDETCTLVRWDNAGGEKGRAPRNIMCAVYANGALHWRISDTLKLHPRPNAHYIWNKTISAVLEDFLSPSLATVMGAILDQIGRPSVSLVGNATLCGRNVALAQTFGLHRDPSRWEMTDPEKSARVRIWWGVLITDYWSSIAYGAPPHIRKGFYDVPMPTLDLLIAAPSKVSANQRYASTCFIHLCGLTELLGDILSLVHALKPDPQQFHQAVQQAQSELRNLESVLPAWLPEPNRPGSSNLWFCFLSMRLLLSRVALRASVLLSGNPNNNHPQNNNSDPDPRGQQDTALLDELRDSSSAVLNFVLSLREPQFQDFWLPYATYMLVMAVMVSLRCTVEAQSAEIRRDSFAQLQKFIRHIQDAHDNYDWDIAEYCLERCADPVRKISEYATREQQQQQAQQQVQQQSHQLPHLQQHYIQNSQQHQQSRDPYIQLPPIVHDIPSSASPSGDMASSAGFAPIEEPSLSLSEFFDPNAFDFSWEALWDTPSGINFTI
jgi:hypothetical protein